MFESIRKHSVKCYVFFLNVFLAAVVVFVIREKERSILENSTKKESGPSFEKALNFREGEDSYMSEDSVEQKNEAEKTSPMVEKNTIPPSTVPVAPDPSTVAPPAPKLIVPDRKTKTS